MKVSRCRNEKSREIYTLLMDYFAEDLGAGQGGGGQSSAIVGDSGYAPAIQLHGDVRPIAI
jgi:hypothetical protein